MYEWARPECGAGGGGSGGRDEVSVWRKVSLPELGPPRMSRRRFVDGGSGPVVGVDMVCFFVACFRCFWMDLAKCEMLKSNAPY